MSCIIVKMKTKNNSKVESKKYAELMRSSFTVHVIYRNYEFVVWGKIMKKLYLS